MKNPRIEEILNILQTAAVDGGFKLFVNNGEIVAEDLLSEAPLMFEICFKGVINHPAGGTEGSLAVYP